MASFLFSVVVESEHPQAERGLFVHLRGQLLADLRHPDDRRQARVVTPRADLS